MSNKHSKKLLLTGGTGFIGKNIAGLLRSEFDVFVPKRDELNLLEYDYIREYLLKNNIDIVFHCANPNPVKNTIDAQYNMVSGSLRIFMNLYKCNDLYEKMIYLGSGAEYDKRLDIINIKETECFRSVPKDDYGFSKYIMNQIASKSENIYNLCIFGCYGPGDHSSKFITHCIRCCLENQPITIRQDCRFDYLHVYDLASIVNWMGYNKLNHHMYNASGMEHLYLSQIASIVKTQMKSGNDIVILNSGYNKEYTADGSLLINESHIKPLINMQEGIKMQIMSELNEINKQG